MYLYNDNTRRGKEKPMKHITIHTDRTTMKFPLYFLTPQMIAETIGDRETIQFMSAIPTMDYTEEDAKGFLEFLKYTEDSEEDLELGVFSKETGTFMGMCALENINQEYAVCELGYWLNKAFVGKGYMTECTSALVQYAIKELGMKYINAFVVTEHKKSIALLERLGFIRRELLKNDTENKGVLVDRYWYQLTSQ